jgi:hypothetical protein
MSLWIFAVQTLYGPNLIDDFRRLVPRVALRPPGCYALSCSAPVHPPPRAGADLHHRNFYLNFVRIFDIKFGDRLGTNVYIKFDGRTLLTEGKLCP